MFGWVRKWVDWRRKKAPRSTFATDGFFSAMPRFEPALLRVPEYKAWFDFTTDLNHMALDLIRAHDVASTDSQRVTITALFLRAHKSFQASVLLARRGLVGDARGIIRREVEGAIAANALGNDPGFLDQLKAAYYYGQRRTANVILNSQDYLAMQSPAQVAELRATVAAVNAREAAGEKIADIKWATVAEKHCRDLYNTLYRLMSSDGTHTTIDALNREMVYDAANRFAGFKVGPDISGMVETLKGASLALIWAAEPFIRAFPAEGRTERLQAMLARFETLPADEPVAAQVLEVG
jgi:hypothetical protein